MDAAVFPLLAHNSVSILHFETLSGRRSHRFGSTDSAGHTDDIRSALLYISAKYPKAPLLGVGFSLGANVLTRYVGEEGVNSRLKAAAVLACVRSCGSRQSHCADGPIILLAMGHRGKQQTAGR